jgi:hypothetical protein
VAVRADFAVAPERTAAAQRADALLAGVAVHRWNVVPLMPSLYDGSP